MVVDSALTCCCCCGVVIVNGGGEWLMVNMAVIKLLVLIVM